MSVEGFDAFGHGEYLWQYDISLRLWEVRVQTVASVISRIVDKLRLDSQPHLSTVAHLGKASTMAHISGGCPSPSRPSGKNHL